MTTTNEMTRKQVAEEIHEVYCLHPGSPNSACEKIADWHLAKLTDLRERLLQKVDHAFAPHIARTIRSELLQVPLCPVAKQLSPFNCECWTPNGDGSWSRKKKTEYVYRNIDKDTFCRDCGNPLGGKPRPEAT